MESFLQIKKTEWLELLFDLVFVITFSSVINSAQLGEGSLIFEGLKFLLFTLSLWWMWMIHTIITNRYGSDSNFYKQVTFLLMFIVLLFNSTIASDTYLVIKGVNLLFAVYLLVTSMLNIYTCQIKPESKVFLKRVNNVMYITAAILLFSLFFGPLFGYISLTINLIINILSPWYYVSQSVQVPIKTAHFHERHGLLILIVLGESLLSIAVDIQNDHNYFLSILMFLIVISFAMLYFKNMENSLNKKFSMIHINRKIRFLDLSGYLLMYGHLFLIFGLSFLALEISSVHIGSDNMIQVFTAIASVSLIIISSSLISIADVFKIKVAKHLTNKLIVVLSYIVIILFVGYIYEGIIIILIIQLAFIFINDYVDNKAIEIN